MTNRITIYFEDEQLRQKLETYSKNHGISFSKVVLEFTSAGFLLFQKMRTLNVDLFIEKVNRLEGKLEDAKKEIEFLKGIITGNKEQINTLLGLLSKNERVVQEFGFQKELPNKEREVEKEVKSIKKRRIQIDE